MSDTELLPKSKSEPVRRLEVFTGAGRRRAWSAEEKAQIVAESHEGGESVCAVARRHGLTPQQLFVWRRDARRQQEEADKASVTFAPVMVAGSSPVGAAPAVQIRPGGPSAGMIEIVIGAAMVRIPPATDAATLKTVLQALAALR